MRKSIVRIFVSLVACAVFADAADGATLFVTTTSDSAFGSLRERIAAAAPGDIIAFQIPTTDTGYDSATGVHTLTLTSAELIIAKSLSIRGDGAKIVVQRSTAAGAAQFGIFTVGAGEVTISRLTIRNGARGTAPGIGGGIRNAARLTLNDCTLTDNIAILAGGDVSNEAGAVLEMNGCTISKGAAEGAGGALFNNGGTVTAINCTFSDNASGRGGAIYNAEGSTLSLLNCTISNNRAATSEVAAAGGVENRGTAGVANTIIATNTGTAFDISGAFITFARNFIGKADGSSSSGFVNGVRHDQVGTIAAPKNPLLGPLQENGGPTKTHALLAGSTAIDVTGDDTRAPAYDQRGFSRVGLSDSGAFEVGGLPTALVNISTRIRVETGDNALIGGFIVSGSSPKS